MSVPVENHSPLVMQPIFLTDRDGAPVLVCLFKGTFLLDRRSEPILRLAEQQQPIQLAGKYWGDPEHSSYQYEPEIALMKPSTDVVVIGHAVAPRGGTKEMDVRLRLGPIDKIIRVVGDRQWVKRLGIVDMTSPLPFERIPLTWERAFGGWSSLERNPEVDRFEPRNPVGVGFRAAVYRDEMPLPNLENPRYRLQQYGQTPPPAGFGFVASHWQPRAARAGTYDAAWMRDRAPLLPVDFDPRFYQGAPDDQVVESGLKGGERVEVTGMHPSGSVAFQLPPLTEPDTVVHLRTGTPQRLKTRLDTVILNMDENLVFLLWRAHLRLPNGPHDIRQIQAMVDGHRTLKGEIPAK